MMTVIIFKEYLKEQLVYLCQKILGFFLYVNRKLWKSDKINKDRIVIFSLHKLGDAVFTIPAIKSIQKYSKGKITIFCFEELSPIYQIVLRNIDFCTVKHSEFNIGGRIARRSARNKLSMLNPKIIIDLTGAITTASLLITSRATKIIGMNKEYYRKLYDSFTSISYTSHLRDIYLNVSNLFVNNQATIQDHSIISAPKIIKSIVIHPFAGWRAKEWNLNKFIKLAQELSKTFSVSLLLPLNSLTLDIEQEIKDSQINIIYSKSIEELINVLKNSSLLIGNDSGPIHIASILGKATFTIYGPTNPQFSLPDGSNHGFYQKKIKCSPIYKEKVCYTDGGRSGCPSFECMNGLSVEEVLNGVNLFIDHLQNNSFPK